MGIYADVIATVEMITRHIPRPLSAFTHCGLPALAPANDAPTCQACVKAKTRALDISHTATPVGAFLYWQPTPATAIRPRLNPKVHQLKRGI